MAKDSTTFNIPIFPESLFPIRTYVQFLQIVFAIPILVGIFLLALAIVLPALVAGALALLIIVKREFLGPSPHWQPWFAWYPVRLQTGKVAWLRRVNRLGVYADTESTISLTGVEYKP